MEFKPEVEMAIDLAVRDIAKVVSDMYGADYSRVKKNVGVMVRAACSSVRNDSSWLPQNTNDPWFRSAAPGAVNREVLAQVLPQWWDALDPQSQLNVIMGPAGHHKSEYINALVQKYQDKPESDLQKDAPDLYKAYAAASGHKAPAANPPAPAETASSLKKQADGGDARYDTNAWVQAWIVADDLEYLPEIQALKKSAEPIQQKVEKVKEIARQMAIDRVSEAAQKGGIEIEYDSLGLDARNDRMDWEALVSIPKEDEE